MRRRFHKKAIVAGCLGVALAAGGIAWLRSWHNGQLQIDKAKAAAAEKFATLSAEQMDGMRSRPPTGGYIVRTSGNCCGELIFGQSEVNPTLSGSVTVAGEIPTTILFSTGQAPAVSGRFGNGSPFSEGGGRNPTVSGSISVSGGTQTDAFAARIPIQPLVHHRREDGRQVARVTGTFYWFDSSDRHAPASDLPEELHSAAEDVEKQERLTSTLKKRIDLMPWNATNADKLRQRLLADLGGDLVKLHNLKAHLTWLSVRSGIPGYPSFITKEADISWQWGSSPILEPPAIMASPVRMELEPTR